MFKRIYILEKKGSVMEKIEITNMCMIEDLENERVLVLNKTKGNWTGAVFPGGHVEKGESIIESVKREVKEETGLAVTELQLVGIKNWCVNSDEKDRYIVFLYKTSSYSGELVDTTDEGNVFWVNRNELFKLDFAPGFDKNLKLMIADEMSEYYIYRDEKGTLIEEFK